MDLLHRLPVVRTLHARGLLAPALLAVAVGGVLTYGALEREPPSDKIDAVVEMGPPVIPVRPAFRPELEKTPLAYQADYWRQIGRRAAEHVVLLGASRTPAIVVAPGLALTSIRVVDEVSRAEQLHDATALKPAASPVAVGGPRQTGPMPVPDVPRLVGVDVVRQLALFALADDTAASAFSVVDADTLGAGAFVAAVTLGPLGELRITPGHLASVPPSGAAVDRFDVAIPFPPSTVVAAVIDLDGQLLGLAVDADGGLQLIPARTAVEVARRVSDGLRCQALSVGTLDAAARQILGLTGGVLVEDVVERAFPLGAPVKAGDVLIEWDGHPVATAEQFAAMYAAAEPGQVVPVRVIRERRPVSGELRMPHPDCRPSPEPLTQFPRLGFVAAWLDPAGATGDRGWDVRGVTPGSAAEAAGLQPGDLILAVNGRALTPAAARTAFDRFETRPQPMALTVRREGRVKLLTVSLTPDA